jgi:putative salt-induced outer membrane protein YdiY
MDAGRPIWRTHKSGGVAEAEPQQLTDMNVNETTIRNVCRLALGATALVGGCCLASAAEAAAAPAAEPAPDPTAWKSSAAISVALTRGNSDTLMVNGTVLSEKKWNKNEISLGAGVTYGEDDTSVNASAITGFGQYNRLLSDRFYVYGRADALHDDIAEVAYRVTLGPGAGYYLIKNDKFTLSGELGPGIVFEKLFDEEDRAYWTIRFGEKFTWKINERSRFWQTLDYSPKVDEWVDDYVMTAEAGIETDITKHIALRVVAQDVYRSRPAQDREENDFRLMAGVAYKF